MTDWAKEYWDALHPYSAGGAYVNFMMDEGVDRVQATYRDNYDRLAAIKAKYDPRNLFRVNQNIKPTELIGALSSGPPHAQGRWKHGDIQVQIETTSPHDARRRCRCRIPAVACRAGSDSSGR